MITKKLNNGIEIPMIGFGTYQITDQTECKNSVLEAMKIGYRLIDTAQAYGNEEAVGDGIKSAIDEGVVKREELFVTTKVWFRSYEKEMCEKSIEESLKKLKLDYIDMVLLHWPFGNVYSAWRVLEEYNKKGIIKAIGVSNMEVDRLIDLIEFNEIKPAINQIETNLYCQRQNEKEWFDKLGVGIQAYAPLGQGKANQMFDESIIKELSKKYNKTPAQILLRFLTEINVAVIPKSVHKERMIENFNIFDFELTKEEIDKIKTLDKKEAMIGNPEKPELVEFAMTW